MANTKTQIDLQAIARVTDTHVNGGLRPLKFTDDRKEEFLNFLRKNGNITISAHNVGVCYGTIKLHQRNSPEFDEAVEQAILESVGYAESEIQRRAFEGVEKGVYYQGKKVGTEKQYSDTLALRWLEAYNPSRWSPRSSVDVNSKVEINSSDAKNKLLSMLNVSEDEIIEGEFKESD